jgi:hypothetical protein
LSSAQTLVRTYPGNKPANIELLILLGRDKLLEEEDIGIKVVGATSHAMKEFLSILKNILVLDECEHVLVEVEKRALGIPKDNPHPW